MTFGKLYIINNILKKKVFLLNKINFYSLKASELQHNTDDDIIKIEQLKSLFLITEAYSVRFSYHSSRFTGVKRAGKRYHLL